MTKDKNVCFHLHIPAKVLKLFNFQYSTQTAQKYVPENFILYIVCWGEKWKRIKVYTFTHLSTKHEEITQVVN